MQLKKIIKMYKVKKLKSNEIKFVNELMKMPAKPNRILLPYLWKKNL